MQTASCRSGCRLTLCQIKVNQMPLKRARLVQQGEFMKTRDNCRLSHHVSLAAGKVAIIAMVLLVLITGGCSKEEQAKTPQAPTVEVATVIQKDVPVYSEWVGSLDGSINAVIRPQVTGYLISQNYREGEQVKKGQILFEIDPRTFQAALNQAKAQLSQQKARYDTAKANLARIRPLAAKNAVSQKDLDDAVGAELSARASIEAAQAAVDEAQLNLEFTRITSPVKGIAGIAKTQLGNLVSPNMQEELTSVSTVDPIKVYINISEQEYLKTVASGNKAEQMPLQLILADGTVYPHEGRFALADRQVDPTTGTLKVGALFPNPDNLLRPGQFGRIKAMTQVKKGALLVPQRAVTEMQGKHLVAVVGADNKVDVRPVQVGERIGSDWLIDKGLQPGEQVIAEGTQKVRPGATVIPKPFSPAAAAAPAATEKR
jgi:membrane fusion protein, multidrug efflux system